MRGTLAKRIHSFQAGMPGLTWPKAKRMWNVMMGYPTAGEPKPLPKRRHRNKVHGAPKPGAQTISYLSNFNTLRCNGPTLRAGPFAKRSRRHVLREWRNAIEFERRHPANEMAKKFRAVMEAAAKRVTSFFKRQRPQGTGA